MEHFVAFAAFMVALCGLIPVEAGQNHAILDGSSLHNRALVSLLTDQMQDLYVQGAVALRKSELRHAPHYFSDHLMLVLNSRTYSNSTLARVRSAGWRLHWVDAILPPRPSSFVRFRDQFTKLHLWNLSEFREVVYMDLDTVFLSSLKGPFTVTHPNESCKIWVARDFMDGRFTGTFNMGVAAIRPNATEYQRLYQLMTADTVQYDVTMSEQGWLNVVYKDQWCELDFEKNANLAVYWPPSHNTSLQDIWVSTPIQVVHYTMSKPWECTHQYIPVCELWRSEFNARVAPLTIVTSRYEIDMASGHHNSCLVKLAEMAVPIVIFTADLSWDANITSNETIAFFKVEERQLWASERMFNWDTHMRSMPVTKHQSLLQLKVNLEKANFVSRAVRANCFQSTHFLWVDFSYLCSAWIAEITLPTPVIDRLPRHKIVLNHALQSSGRYSIETTVFGGDMHAWRSWHRAFYSALERKHRHGEPIAGDHDVVASVFQSSPNISCHLTAAPTLDSHPMLLFHMYLAGTDTGQTCV